MKSLKPILLLLIPFFTQAQTIDTLKGYERINLPHPFNIDELCAKKSVGKDYFLLRSTRLTENADEIIVLLVYKKHFSEECIRAIENLEGNDYFLKIDKCLFRMIPHHKLWSTKSSYPDLKRLQIHGPQLIYDRKTKEFLRTGCC